MYFRDTSITVINNFKCNLNNLLDVALLMLDLKRLTAEARADSDTPHRGKADVYKYSGERRCN